MSDVISAWVDSDEMRRLAERLLARPSAQDLKRMEINFGSQFEGYAPEFIHPPDPPATVSSPRQPVQAAPPSEPTRPLRPLTTAFSSQDATSPPRTLTPPKLAPLVPREESLDPVVPSLGVMKSAVNFLKKAQVEGMAGGIIRSGAPPKNDAPAPATPVPAPKAEAPEQTLEQTPESPAPLAPGDSKPVPFSPFRRVSDSERAPVSAPPVARKIVRPPTPSGDDPILARVRHFGAWLKGPVGARNFFISNVEGKILIDEVGNPKLIQVARTLAGASKVGSEESSEVASLHVRIGDDAILEVIPTPSQFGTLILGLIVSHSLSEDSIREVRAGLQEAADARLIQIQSRRA